MLSMQEMYTLAAGAEQRPNSNYRSFFVGGLVVAIAGDCAVRHGSDGLSLPSSCLCSHSRSTGTVLRPD